MPHIARERYSELVDAKLRATIVKRVGIICNNRYEGSPKAGAVKVPVRDTEVTVADYNKKTGTADGDRRFCRAGNRRHRHGQHCCPDQGQHL